MKRKKNEKKDDKNNRTQQKMVWLWTLGQALGLHRMSRGLWAAVSICWCRGGGSAPRCRLTGRQRRFAVLDLASSAIVTGGSAVDEK
jgi:hypothetical protein